MPARSLRDAISTNGGGQQIAPMDARPRGEYGRNISGRPRGENFVLHGLLRSENLPGAVYRATQQRFQMAANNSDFAPGAAMTEPIREEIREELKDKIALAEAHTDTKIERLGGELGGKIDVLITKIDSLKDDVSKSDQYNRNTKLAVISTIVGVGLASAISISLLFIALATYGDALFGRGMNVRDVVHAVITEQQEIQKRETTQQQRH
jgi:hypothetical protein